MAKRDEHLRSAEFFDVAEHPEVRFVGETAVIDGDTLKVRGELHAAGRQVPLDVDAALREVDGEFEPRGDGARRPPKARNDMEPGGNRCAPPAS